MKLDVFKDGHCVSSEPRVVENAVQEVEGDAGLRMDAVGVQVVDLLKLPNV